MFLLCSRCCVYDFLEIYLVYNLTVTGNVRLSVFESDKVKLDRMKLDGF